jgi:hypothetical protein
MEKKRIIKDKQTDIQKMNRRFVSWKGKKNNQNEKKFRHNQYPMFDIQSDGSFQVAESAYILDSKLT